MQTLRTNIQSSLAATLATVIFLTSVQSVSAAPCTQVGNDSALTIQTTDVSCTLPENVIGADGGTVTVAANTTMILGASQVLVYTTGLNIQSGAVISLNSTGALRKGNIYVTDTDADGYRLNNSTDAQFSTTPVAGKVRKSTTVGFDSNDAVSCPNGYTGYTCRTCSNGATVNIANGSDPYNHCTAAWNGCSNTCTRTATVGDVCNGAGACATATQYLGFGQRCSAGTIQAQACSSGYQCNGAGGCCYTDIYGEHCI